MVARTIKSNNQTFDYDGHQMADADGNSLSWDENGQMTNGVNSKTFTWNWDGLLRSTSGGTAVNIKYDPSGNRVRRQAGAINRRYIVDIVGGQPVILLELDAASTIKRTYIYANSQLIAYHPTGGATTSRYFLLHDRLGSVRQIIGTSGGIYAYYTYSPFGETLEIGGSLSVNPFRFTGQWYDSEIGQYYLRARQYDPYLGIFTAIDPACGDYKEPRTLHEYLYCENDSVNRTDPTGELSGLVMLTSYYALLDFALSDVRNPVDILNWFQSINILREEVLMLPNASFAAVLADASVRGSRYFLSDDDNWYGNYCGQHNKLGTPKDELDWACSHHDDCYTEARVSGIRQQNANGRACDRKLCEEARNVNCDLSSTPGECHIARIQVMTVMCTSGLRQDCYEGSRQRL